jgi:hypothetical protein
MDRSTGSKNLLPRYDAQQFHLAKSEAVAGITTSHAFQFVFVGWSLRVVWVDVDRVVIYFCTLSVFLFIVF